MRPLARGLLWLVLLGLLAGVAIALLVIGFLRAWSPDAIASSGAAAVLALIWADAFRLALTTSIEQLELLAAPRSTPIPPRATAAHSARTQLVVVRAPLPRHPRPEALN